MYPRYNMAYNRRNMYGNFGRRNNNFFGGGFLVPFVLGGIAGSAFSRPNFYQPYYYNNFYYSPFFW